MKALPLAAAAQIRIDRFVCATLWGTEVKGRDVARLSRRLISLPGTFRSSFAVGHVRQVVRDSAQPADVHPGFWKPLGAGRVATRIPDHPTLRLDLCIDL